MTEGGTILDAQTALEWGLISEITVDPVARSIELAEAVAQRDSLATRLAKIAIDLVISTDGLQFEGVAQALLYDRQQHEE